MVYAGEQARIDDHPLHHQLIRTLRQARASGSTSLPLIDRLTHQTGLVTSEMVPAFRATGATLTHGGLRLAHLDHDHEQPV